MPGEISTSYDPEWGTSSQKADIDHALAGVYEKVSTLLGKPPIDIRVLVHEDFPLHMAACFTEKDWRLIRFALERARESL